MELSERYIKQLESENFVYVYEHQDQPGAVYERHSHKGKVSMFVTDGSVTFDFDGEKQTVTAGKRIDIPVSVEHSAIVGDEGVIFIIGEEIDGDS